MTGEDTARFSGWAVAAAAVAAAVLTRWLLDPLLGERLPFTFFFIAVAVAAWHGGLRPALFAAGAGFALAVYFFVEPRSSMAVGKPVDQIGLASYGLAAAVIVALGEAVHRARRRAERRRETLQVTLRSIGEAVITTDLAGRVTSMNPVAQALCGWREHEAQGRPLDAVFRIVNETTRATVENPAAKVLAQGTVVGLANHTLLIARDGSERPIDDSAAPIRNAAGMLLGVVLVFRDVSEKKHAEEALRRWQHIFDHAGWPVAVTDAATGTLEAANPAFEAMHGHGVGELQGRPFDTVVAPEDRAALARHVQTAHAQGEVRYEALHQRKDGTRFPVLTHASAFHDAHGRVAYRAATFVDLTRIRAVETELRAARADLETRVAQRTAELARSNRFLQALLESVDDGIVACDENGTLSLFNRASREWHGLPQEPLPAETWAQHYDLFQGDGCTPLQREEVPLFRALAGERVHDVQMVIAPRNGPARTLLASGQPFHDDDGRLLGAVVSMHDVTEQRRAEGALRAAHAELERRIELRTAQLARSNEQLQAQAAERAQAEQVAARAAAQLQLISDAVPALISYVDQERRYLLNNRAYEHWFGHERNALTGRPMREVLGEPAWQVVGPRIDAAFAGQEQTYEAELPYRDGGSRWVRATYTPNAGADGRIEGVVVLVIDITESKRVEKALKEADRRKDEFLATLAHELRNPLAPLRTGLQVLRRAGDDAAKAEQVRAMMERQLAQMVRLLDDLLDVSRISRGSFELRLERTRLADVVQHALETCAPVLQERDHALTVSPPPPEAMLQADPARLSQAICNLLTNAARYTEPRGHIALAAQVSDGQATVSVKDDGIGIDAARIERVFDMFTTEARGQPIAQQGLGIGLSIVKRLIELHGGTVEARSEGPGRGSEFVLRLPLAAADACGDAGPARLSSAEALPATDAGDAAGPPAAPTRRRVLVVDDNRDAADSLALMLDQMGHDTRVAYGGAQALEEAAAFRPDTVFMDIGMPGLSGHDVARRLRGTAAGRTPLLVAVTGWGQAEDRRRSADAGFDLHLVKPIEPGRLDEVLGRPGAPTA